MVIGPEEDSSAEAILKKLMAFRLIINSNSFCWKRSCTTLSLFDIEQCYRASLKNRVERKEMLIEKGWSCG